jgi:hypothetical protein
MLYQRQRNNAAILAAVVTESSPRFGGKMPPDPDVSGLEANGTFNL